MRPEVQRQQPHHFIRRHPRARRDLRKTRHQTLLTVEVSQSDHRWVNEWRGLKPNVLIIQMLQAEARKACPAGLKLEAVGAVDIDRDDFGQKIRGRMWVKFTRVK